MIASFKAHYLSVCVAAILGLSGCAATPVAELSPLVEVQKNLVLDLKAGEVLQFALVRSREGEAAQAVRTRYFQTAIPYAKSLGDRSLGTLRIRDTLLGTQSPKAIALYAFPDKAAQTKFQQSPDWDDYQRMRREGWEELHVLSVTIPSDMVLSFDPTKDYTLAAAWTNPGTMPDYQQYLDGIEPDFGEIGARYVAQFKDVNLQSQTDKADHPSQLTIVEWSDGPNVRGLSQTDGYKNNADAFQRAISRFDLYWFEVS